jgi:hypothetical protein
LKTPILGGVKEIASGVEDHALENIEDGPEQWKTGEKNERKKIKNMYTTFIQISVCRIALPLAFVCRYLWATDKMRLGFDDSISGYKCLITFITHSWFISTIS